MTRVDLITALSRAGFFRGQWSLDDEVYDAVSTAFVFQAWEAWVDSLPNELKHQVDVGGGKMVWVPKWIPEVFDCDNIAADFAIFLDRCMAVDAVKLGKPRGNCGSGRFNFLREGNIKLPHCRNWTIDYDGVAHAFDAGNGQLDGQSLAENETISSGETL